MNLTQNQNQNQNQATEYPIANPSDVSMLQNRIDAEECLYRMWAGAYGDTIAYVWADSFESAFEIFVEYLDDNAPGLLVSHEEMAELYTEALHELFGVRESHPDAEMYTEQEQEQAREQAEADLTIIGHTTLEYGGAIASHEWGGDEVSGQEWKDVHVRSLAEVLEADVAQIVEQLTELKNECDDETTRMDDPVCTEARLQVQRDGQWQLHSGDAAFDQDRRGYWGASAVSAEDTAESLAETARDLIAQALDMVAQ